MTSKFGGWIASRARSSHLAIQKALFLPFTMSERVPERSNQRKLLKLRRSDEARSDFSVASEPLGLHHSRRAFTLSLGGSQARNEPAGRGEVVTYSAALERLAQ